MGDPSLVTLSCAAARTSHQRAAYATEPIWIETSVNVLAQGARKYLRKRDRENAGTC
jgi:hypothetical protein